MIKRDNSLVMLHSMTSYCTSATVTLPLIGWTRVKCTIRRNRPLLPWEERDKARQLARSFTLALTVQERCHCDTAIKRTHMPLWETHMTTICLAVLIIKFVILHSNSPTAWVQLWHCHLLNAQASTTRKSVIGSCTLLRLVNIVVDKFARNDILMNSLSITQSYGHWVFLPRICTYA